MANKPRIAFYWCSSCGGCEEAVVDLAEDLLDVASRVEIVLWPVAMDFKKSDVKAMEDRSIDATFINGAVRLSEQEEWVHLLRKKSKLVIAFGACAHLGGIPGLANFCNRDKVFKTVYHELPSMENPDEKEPLRRVTVDGAPLELPEFFDRVRTVSQVVEVDYTLPGCPPPTDLILVALRSLLEGTLPPRGSILAPDKALCETCPRKESKPESMAIDRIKRVGTSQPDPVLCFLADGFVCLGPATRSGCGETCIRGNMPCRGCFGPPPGQKDQGASFLGALGTLLSAGGCDEAEGLVQALPDPAGTLYRYALPASLLRGRREKP
jgi:F420-non-reducing hydrogenase small subunit